MNKMRMFSGQLVDPLNLQPSDIRGDDIAWALSNICRYGGHSHRHFSVAEHSLEVSYKVAPAKKLTALLHDGSEAYLGDIPTPIKRRLPAFQEAEARAHLAIATAFGLDPEQFFFDIEHGDVKKADIEALHAEQSFLWDRPTILPRKSPIYSAALLFAELKCYVPLARHAALSLDRPIIF